MNSSSCWNVRASPRRARFDGDVFVIFWPARNTSPALRVEQPGQHAEQRGLAGAVGTHEADDRGRRHRHAHVAEGDEAAEADGDVAGFERRAFPRRLRCGGRAPWRSRAAPPLQWCRRVATVRATAVDHRRAAADRGAPRTRWPPAPHGAAARGLVEHPLEAHGLLVHGALGVLRRARWRRDRRGGPGACDHGASSLSTVWMNAGENVKRSPASSAAMLERTPKVTSTASHARPSRVA